MTYYNEIVQKDLERLLTEKLDYNQFKDKTFLITGATGMIASYYIYLLMYLNDTLNLNIKIILLARNEEKVREKFMEKERKDIIFIKQDVCEKFHFESDIDYILHMASSANPKTIKEDPVGIIKSNLLGTINMLDLAKEKNSEIIFTSTREIYGEVNNVNKIKEEDMGILNCFEHRACYPESKRLAETLLLNYSKQYGVKFKNLRIAHSYGPGMNINNDGRIMSDLIENVVNKQNIVLKSKGDALRAFCYITDTISAISYIILNGENANSYNIANETEEISIRDLATLLATINGVEVEYKIENNTGLYTNFKRVGLDTSKLEKLGWQPKINLENGLKNTVQSYKKEVLECKKILKIKF